MAASRRSAHTFDRMFNPDDLCVRKDVSPTMLAAAKGNLEEVKKGWDENAFEIGFKNKDGNTLLLVAVANNRIEVATFLLDAKSDILHKNELQMDALDYASMEGVKAPICRKMLGYCDYVTPEIIDGPYRVDNQMALAKLRESGLVCVRSSIVGKLPDFRDIFSRDTEYRTEWKNALQYLCNTVRKGILLLSDEITYLERDALLSGTLEVDMRRRHVYQPAAGECLRFGLALEHVYRARMEARMVEASAEGDATAVKGLLKAKAHPNLEDARGQTLLMVAAHSGFPLVVRCLLMAAANCNHVNKDGFTPLMLAATNNHEKALEVLLKARADTTMKSNKGHTVLDFSQHAGHAKILKALHHHADKKKR